MSNNRVQAGLAIAAKLKAKDPNYYKKLGAMGGAVSKTGGFFGNPELARRAGKLGGTVSRRGPKESFFIEDSQIDDRIIEPFNRQPWHKGWFKRSK